MKRSLISHAGLFNKTYQDSIFQMYPELNNMSFETLGGSNAQITKVETQTNSQNIIELDYVAIDFNGVMFEALQYVVPEIYDNQNNIIT